VLSPREVRETETAATGTAPTWTSSATLTYSATDFNGDSGTSIAFTLASTSSADEVWVATIPAEA